MIDTLLFDLGNVFIGVDPSGAAARLADRCDGCSVEEIMDVFQRSDLVDLYQNGTLDTLSFYQSVKQKLKGTFSFNEFKVLWNDMFTPNTLMIDLLPVFSERYRIGLVSNTNEMHINSLTRTYDFFECFDAVVLSYEVHSSKPGHEIYRIGLERIGSVANSTAFIDDRPENGHAAREMGMEAFQFRMPSFVKEVGTKIEQDIRERFLHDV